MMVTDKELREDIANTRREIEGYKHLIEGFKILQRLPESSPMQYKLLITRYETALNECKQFLQQLLAIQKEREEQENGEDNYKH